MRSSYPQPPAPSTHPAAPGHTAAAPRPRWRHLTRVAFAAGLAVAGLLTAAAPAAAAATYPRTTFDLSGTKGAASGGVDWYNRSINVDGLLSDQHDLGCVRLYAWVTGNSVEWSGEVGRNCVGPHGIQMMDKTIPIDEMGGAQHVELHLQSQLGTLWRVFDQVELDRP